LGGVPVGVVQMMDFASLATQAASPPTISVMVRFSLRVVGWTIT
jgi:hypothetical protein